MSPRRSPPPRSASPRHRRRPGPDDGASAPHPSYPWQWRAGAAHQRWMRQNGVSAWEVAGQLGHKSREYRTTELYAAFDPAYLENAVRAIDLLFDGLRASGRALLQGGPAPKASTVGAGHIDEIPLRIPETHTSRTS